MRLDAIVAQLGGELVGDGSVEVFQVASLTSAGSGEIAFLSNPKFRQQLQATRASAVIVTQKHVEDTAIPRIVHPNPYVYYARVVALLNPPSLPTRLIHPMTAVE